MLFNQSTLSIFIENLQPIDMHKFQVEYLISIFAFSIFAIKYSIFARKKLMPFLTTNYWFNFKN